MWRKKYNFEMAIIVTDDVEVSMQARIEKYQFLLLFGTRTEDIYSLERDLSRINIQLLETFKYEKRRNCSLVLLFSDTFDILMYSIMDA